MRTSISSRRANRRDDAPLAAAAVVPPLRGLITATIITLAPSLVPTRRPLFLASLVLAGNTAVVVREGPSRHQSTISGERSEFFLLTIFKVPPGPTPLSSLSVDKSGINISQLTSKTVFASDLLSRKLP